MLFVESDELFNMDEELLLEEIASLRAELREKEANLAELRREKQILQTNGLNNEEIARYSRQILLPDIGVKGKSIPQSLYRWIKL